MRTTELSVYYRGLMISGTIVYGDWEGDPDVPSGVNVWPPYAEDIQVCSVDGDDITDMLTDKALEECEGVLIEEAVQ